MACKELVRRVVLESVDVVLVAADVEIVAIEVDTGMSHQDATHVVWPLGQQLSLSHFIKTETWV
jgi:hypothetical protein